MAEAKAEKKSDGADHKKWRGWVFTWFMENPDEYKWADHAARITQNFDDKVLLGAQKERCPDTKEIHLQGFVYFANARTLVAAKKWLTTKADFCDRVHLATMRGTVDQSRKYCSKEESRLDEGYIELGNQKLGNQGRRSDISNAYDDLKEGMTLLDFLDSHAPVYFKYNRAVERVMSLYDKPKRRSPMTVRYWFGGPNKGKTWLAEGYCGNRPFYKVTSPWFCNYNGEDIMIIDDFHTEFLEYHFLLQLLDGSPLALPRKGVSPVPCKATTILITSNLSPAQCYATKPMQPHVRRITEVIEVKGKLRQENKVRHFVYNHDDRDPSERPVDDEEGA